MNIFFISSHPANFKQEKMFDAVLASNKTKILMKQKEETRHFIGCLLFG